MNEKGKLSEKLKNGILIACGVGAALFGVFRSIGSGDDSAVIEEGDESFTVREVESEETEEVTEKGDGD